MKVVFISRATLFTVAGGDTIQIVQTARELSSLGIEVDIRLTHESINYSDYDLLHFFNITRPADILFHIRRTKKPFAISTILIDYSAYDRGQRGGISGLALRLFSADSVEYIKCIARCLKGQDKLMTLSYLRMGQHKSVSQILKKASLVFSNSRMETEALEHRFNCKTVCIPVPNGIDPELFSFDESAEKDPSLILCVARIEGIKNQINLIRALRNTKYTLLIIGSPAPNQQSYFHECRRMATRNIRFIAHMEQQQLVEYYRRAKVHVLPSWFEACGLSSLEAAAMGCNIVVTARGYTREYYREHGFYCDPGSPRSIFEAVDTAARAPVQTAFREKILSVYTWSKAASRIAKAYYYANPRPECVERNIEVPQQKYFQPIQRS